MTTGFVRLHVLATGDAMMNLLAVDWVQQKYPEKLSVVVWTTPGMKAQGKKFSEAIRSKSVSVEVVTLPAAPPRSKSGTPSAWKDLMKDNWKKMDSGSSHQIWAYGGATKPLSIATWLLCGELAKEQGTGKHTSIYPDQRARVWLVDDKEQPLKTRIDLPRLLKVRGALMKESTVLTPEEVMTFKSVGSVKEAKAALSKNSDLTEYLSTIAKTKNMNPDLVFESLVIARAIDVLRTRKDITYAYANADPIDSYGIKIGEKDLLWISSSARVFVLDAKNKRKGEGLQGEHGAQERRLRDIAGRYSFLAYALPMFAGRVAAPKLPIIPFDAGSKFEESLSAWIDDMIEKSI